MLRVLKLDTTWGMALWWAWLLFGFFGVPVVDDVDPQLQVALLRIATMAGFTVAAVLFISVESISGFHIASFDVQVGQPLSPRTRTLVVVCACISSVSGLAWAFVSAVGTGFATLCVILAIGAIGCGCMMLAWLRAVFSFGMRVAMEVFGLSVILGSAIRLVLGAVGSASAMASAILFALVPIAMLALYLRTIARPAPLHGEMEELEEGDAKIKPIFMAYGSLYSAFYGFLLTISSYEAGLGQAVVACAVGAIAAGAMLLVTEIRTHATPIYRVSFEIALVLMALAFVSLAFGVGGAWAPVVCTLLTAAGYIYFWLLYCSVWIEIAARGHVRVLQVGAWGFAASTAALIVGVVVALGVRPLLMAQEITMIAKICTLACFVMLLMNIFMSDSSIFANLGGMIELPVTADGDSADKRVQALAEQRGLTPRETQIALLLARGRNPSRIHDELEISVNTARTHIRHIYEKCGVHSFQEFLDLLDM